MEYLPPLDLLVINQAETGVRGGTATDLGLVYAAAMRPQAFLAGVEPYPDVFTKAASLLHSIVAWYPFAQGNYATAMTAAFVMCELNGYIATASWEDEQHLVQAAASDLGVEQIAEVLRGWTQPAN